MPGVAIPRPAARLTASWTAHADDHVIGVEWLASGEACAVGTVGGTLLVLESERGAVRFKQSAHRRGLASLSCDPRGAYIATCGQDGVVRTWDAQNGKQLAALPADADWAERVAWSPDGAFLACAAGRAVRIWDRDGRLVRDYPKHQATVTDIQWQPGGSILCSTSYGGVTLFDPAKDAPLRTFSWQGSSLSARWSPSGRYIATGEQDSTVHFWIVQTGQDLQMSGYPRKVRELAWDAKGRLLATGGGNDVTVWDCGGRGPAGSKPITLPGHEAPVTAIAFQHHGPVLASGGADGRIVLWNPTHSRKLVGAMVLDEPVSQVAWSHDDRTLVVGCAAGQVVLIPMPGRADSR